LIKYSSDESLNQVEIAHARDDLKPRTQRSIYCGTGARRLIVVLAAIRSPPCDITRCAPHKRIGRFARRHAAQWTTRALAVKQRRVRKLPRASQSQNWEAEQYVDAG
jgi:aminoglycoside phosphotransferase (APT) family kinase protein